MTWILHLLLQSQSHRSLRLLLFFPFYVLSLVSIGYFLCLSLLILSSVLSIQMLSKRFISVIFSLLIFSFGSLKNLLFLCWGCIFTSCVHNCLLNAFSTAAFTPLWSHSNTSPMLVLSSVDCPFSPVQCLPGSCYDKWFFHWKPNILCIGRFWILFKPSALDDFFWRHAGREVGVLPCYSQAGVELRWIHCGYSLLLRVGWESWLCTRPPWHYGGGGLVTAGWWWRSWLSASQYVIPLRRGGAPQYCQGLGEARLLLWSQLTPQKQGGSFLPT